VELILWRHADAENGAPDSERRLTAKGLKQADRMASWLRKRVPEDSMVLVSEAARAQQTARALTKNFETSIEVGTGATPEMMLRAAGWPNRKGAVIIVGHQPTLGEVAAQVLTGKSLQWSIKKGAIWWLASRERERNAVVRAVISPEML